MAKLDTDPDKFYHNIGKKTEKTESCPQGPSRILVCFFRCIVVTYWAPSFGSSITHMLCAKSEAASYQNLLVKHGMAELLIKIQ